MWQHLNNIEVSTLKIRAIMVILVIKRKLIIYITYFFEELVTKHSGN